MQIGSIIRRAALQFKDAPCLTEGERTLSFREFDQATDRLGNALTAKGLQPGDRVVAVVAGPPGLDAAAIEAFARERLSGVKRPKQVHVWAELPKSGANKILRRSVRDTLLQAMAASVDE